MLAIFAGNDAKQLIKPMPRLGEFVFTANGTRPFSGFSKAKQRLNELSNVKDWRLHDIRRTVATGMAKFGTPPHIADKLLNQQTGVLFRVSRLSISVTRFSMNVSMRSKVGGYMFRLC